MKTTELVGVGARAPQFSLVDQDGTTHTLKSYKGKTVILYFYPKDDTPGCTKEACDFRDRQTQLKKKGAVVLGVSPDAPAKHLKFIKKYDLNFTLLSDEEKTVCEDYGVWQLKKFMGREFMGVVRSTFVIGPDGKIKEAVRKVKVDGHADAMLEAI
jgi:peroxiredoxin Q/BCP